MAEVTIVVRGSAESKAPPDRATVRLAAASEGESRVRAVTAVRDTAATLSEQLSRLHAEGAVADWASDQLHTSAQRPWDGPARGGSMLHHARVEFRATFADFAAMGTWLSEVTRVDVVAVSGVEWSLTAARHHELAERARADAVADAVAKANSYARHLGLGEVRPVAIADVGMLPGDGPEHPGMALAAFGRSSAPESAGEPVALVPQEVVLTIAVDARFVAE